MNTPSYYAIIPANVRYDNTLTANEKLLYGEITCLSNLNGHCHATNQYFAELYNLSKGRISLMINNLVRKGYIVSVINYKEGTKKVESRYLSLPQIPPVKNTNTPIQKQLYPIVENEDTPIVENVKDNNTSIEYYKINNKKINKKELVFNFDGFTEPEKNKIKEWLEYKEEIKKPYKSQKSLDALRKDLINRKGNLVEDIDYSIKQGYSGIFSAPVIHNRLKTQRDSIQEALHRCNSQDYSGDF